MQSLQRTLLGALAGAALALGASAAQAQADDFPSKPIRIVVPFAAGGTMDLFGRLVGGEMAKALGQTVVVENMPGAGGSIATGNVARSAPDGYSICFCATGSTVILPLMDAKLPYKVATDLPPVGHVLRIEQTILVNADKGAANLAALIAKAKGKPGGMFYGTPGNGTSNHLAGELFKIAAGLDIGTVHYKGESAAVLDLLTGQIDFMVASVSFADPQVKSGKLRILALTGPKRVSAYPDVPTIAESGVPGYSGTSWFTFAAPASMPPALVDKLNKDVQRVLASPEVVARYHQLGLNFAPNTPAEAAAFFKSETVKWNRVIEAANLQLD